MGTGEIVNVQIKRARVLEHFVNKPACLASSTTKRLVSQDPVRLADIVARAIQRNELQKVAYMCIMQPN